MCGITGIITASDKAVREHIRAMTERLRHRGPDGSGYFSEKAVTFGHRRLSIIDLTDRGHQPMLYMERYVITFNGEIYNYLELKEELVKAGYRFESSTDTEVVMAAYDRWGVSCLAKMNGMWAFALYDRKEEKLFISRDRFGVKPLFYYLDGRVFLFASEIKALLAYPEIKTSPDTDVCRRYLRSGPMVWLGDTEFRGIRHFPPSCYVLQKPEELIRGDFKPQRYWETRPFVENVPFSHKQAVEFADRYRTILKDAVKLRLRSDVKVGSALSGGLDSSSIVKFVNLLHEESGTSHEKQETFSTVYRSAGTRDCDESEYILELSKTLGVRAHFIEPELKELIKEHRRIIYHMDIPPDTSLLSSWHTYRLVATTDVVVTLDGQGADEQLGGYFTFLRNYIATSKNPWKEFKLFSRLEGSEEFLRSGLMIAAVRILSGGSFRKIMKLFGKDPMVLRPLNEVLHHEVMTSLQNLLLYGDRASMAFSIESRMPFMDYRMVEFTCQLPATYKIHDGWTKYIARKAMNHLLPPSITWRRDKKGWPIPDEFWFRGKLASWLAHEVETSEFLKSLGEGQDIRKRLSSKEPIKSLLRLLNLATWHRVFFEKRYDLSLLSPPQRSKK